MTDNLTFSFQPTEGDSLKWESISFDPPRELGGSITHKQALIIREVLLLGCGITQASVAIGYTPSYLSQGLNAFHSSWPTKFQEWVSYFVEASKRKRLKKKQKIEAFDNWRKGRTKALDSIIKDAEEDSLPDISIEGGVRMQVILTKSQREWLRLKAYEEETQMSKIVRRVVSEAMNEPSSALEKLVDEQAEEIENLKTVNRKLRSYMYRMTNITYKSLLEQSALREEAHAVRSEHGDDT